MASSSTAPSSPVGRVEAPTTVTVHAEIGHCHFHRSKSLDLYCKLHKEVICTNCLVTRHYQCHHQCTEGSPFQPVEEAAVELQGKLQSVVAVEKAKEKCLYEALNSVDATQEEIEEQVAVLSGQVKDTRDRLIAEAKRWCEQHMQRLEFMAQVKDEAIAHQEELLQAKLDAVTTYHRNLTSTLSAARSEDEVINACHRLLEKVSPVTELTASELEPTEKANLIFKQEGKERIITQIMALGFSGVVEEPTPVVVVEEEVFEEPKPVVVEDEEEEEVFEEAEQVVEAPFPEAAEEEEEEVEEEVVVEEEEDSEPADDSELFSFR